MSSASKKLIQASAGQAGGGDFYPYTVDNSARFDGTSYLTRTNVAGSSSNSDFSFSFWAKLWGSTADNYIFAADSANTGHVSTQSNIQFAGGELRSYFASNYEGYMTTSAVFRDVSSWYHFLVVYDASEPYGSRGKIYVNGIETPLSTDTLNLASGGAGHHFFDSGKQVRISGNAVGVADSYNRCAEVYMAQVVMIDGQALDPTSFGEEKNGVWIPKNPSGLTFGTNGFYLDFADSSNLGNDVSGNNNDFTSSGLTSSDQMSDTPTNNFATMNPIWQINLASTTEATLSDGNLTATTASTPVYNNSVATMPFPSTGKWYCEAKFTGYVNSAIYAGVIAGLGQVPGATYNVNNFYVPGDSSGDCSISLLTGKKRISQVVTDYGTAVASGSVVMFAVDMDNRKIYFGDDGTWMNSGDPVAGTGFATDTLVDEVFLALTSYSNGDKYEVNFGQTPFAYTPPTDFLALCTANLPEPTIGPNSDIKPSDVFGVEIYTGNGTAIGSGGNAVDCGVDMTDGDYMVAIKDRDSAVNWMVFDTVRGDGKFIEFNTTNIEYTNSETLTFTSTGVTLGSNGNVNSSGNDYVLYWFKATAGFFDIVSFDLEATGNINIPHNLGVSPQFLTFKALANGAQLESWFTYCESLPVSDPETDFIYLDKTNAVADNNTVWNDTAPTSSVFTVGSGFTIANYGTPQIAYLFADVEGFCKIGYYKGNGSTDGPFHYLGFSPEMSISRSSSTTSNWIIQDTERNTYNPVDTPSILDGADAEYTANSQRDFVSNGLKMRATGTPINLSGEDYITLSIGTSSKYSNAR